MRNLTLILWEIHWGEWYSIMLYPYDEAFLLLYSCKLCLWHSLICSCWLSRLWRVTRASCYRQIHMGDKQFPSGESRFCFQFYKLKQCQDRCKEESTDWYFVLVLSLSSPKCHVVFVVSVIVFTSLMFTSGTPLNICKFSIINSLMYDIFFFSFFHRTK